MQMGMHTRKPALGRHGRQCRQTGVLNYVRFHKFIEYKIQNKAEFATQWLEASDALKDDQILFGLLRETLPSTSKKDTFFAHMFVVHDYPAPCFFTIFGKHRTIDVTWTIKGIRCKGAKQCNNPQFISQCPPRKIRHK